MTITIDSVVSLKATVNHKCPEGRDDNKTATVFAITNGDQVMLREDLHGCRYWNIEDLQLEDNTSV